eukprot:CAMPEP_0117760688 /NCGR_PEP_ID=MMETSP0947-20121206/16789_1 /TAXON_ID=44440 /ORGANISM="Chattonella subsalsa, Strain CCMP2191" /LENGTH=222 /DNA_ID=CAMNT_0005581447 /DNA_START=624 /DNA_END=1289 /DNA_ORIENTATION=-
MELDHISKVGPSCGYTLSVDEKSGLSVSMLQRQREEVFLTRLQFWGKVIGIEDDYLICFALLPAEDLPLKKFYYCTCKDYTLRQMPELTDEYKKMAAEITTRFKGDPSLPLDGGEEEEEEGEEAQLKERFREIHRLTYTIQLIDRDVSVVPKGAYLMEASHQISKNSGFEGLSHEAAGELRNYFHFRAPESAYARAAIKRQGLVSPNEFLDPITTDEPDGLW